MIFYMQDCEEKLGYTFKDKQLLRQCFTHSSYTNEHTNTKDNERLEFFGDSILGFIVAEYLIENNKTCDEGVLSRLKSQLVSKEPLSKVIENMDISQFILYGEGEKRNNSGKRQSINENLFEAIVAGIYIDGGIECAKKFVLENLIKKQKSIISERRTSVTGDPKSKLQEYVQKGHIGKIEYVEKDRVGPPHNPTFTMSVYLNETLLAEGVGGNKTIASKEAAKKALEVLKKRR